MPVRVRGARPDECRTALVPRCTSAGKRLCVILAITGALFLSFGCKSALAADANANWSYDGTTLTVGWSGGSPASIQCWSHGIYVSTTDASYSPASLTGTELSAQYSAGDVVDCTLLQLQQSVYLSEASFVMGTAGITSNPSGALSTQGDSTPTSDQLNLVWWGVWFLCGLVTMSLVQPYWDRLFNWWMNPT